MFSTEEKIQDVCSKIVPLNSRLKELTRQRDRKKWQLENEVAFDVEKAQKQFNETLESTLKSKGREMLREIEILNHEIDSVKSRAEELAERKLNLCTKVVREANAPLCNKIDQLKSDFEKAEQEETKLREECRQKGAVYEKHRTAGPEDFRLNPYAQDDYMRGCTQLRGAAYEVQQRLNRKTSEVEKLRQERDKHQQELMRLIFAEVKKYEINNSRNS